MELICKNVIKKFEKENNEIEYTIKYENYNEFNKLTNLDIDNLFKIVIKDYFDKKKIKLDSKNGYLESIDSSIMKTFFESFFEEFESAKGNIKIIIDTIEEYKKLYKNNEILFKKNNY
jgi:hypothetical protein